MHPSQRTERRETLRQKILEQKLSICDSEDTCSESDDESLTSEELIDLKLEHIKAILTHHAAVEGSHNLLESLYTQHIQPPVEIPRHLQSVCRCLVAGKQIPYTIDMVCNIRRRRCRMALPLVHEEIDVVALK